jgi:hypothetical protein
MPGRLKTDISPRRDIREIRTFVLEAGQSRIELERTFIVQGSDSLILDGKPLRRGDDYRINTLKGSLTLVTPAEGGETLVASYMRYPISFSPVFASRFPEGTPPEGLESAAAKPSARPVRSETKDPLRLRVTGSKTVGFTMGSNKDLGIDQSLKVTMAGKVAEDLEVKASLSDDNLPVQPEGNTEELKHLDRVFVEVRSKHAGVQLGDYTASLGWSRFSAFQRELRGVNADVRLGERSFFAGGGLTKGRFQTESFMGRQGMQGPYELLSARRFNGLIILPGTEIVYLNGRLLRRGAENEYTIDYNRGSITFTERIAITEDSEIVVDFQTGEDGYERTTLTGGLTSSWFGEALRFRSYYFQESDDTNRPVRGTLTEEDRQVLEEAGDDQSLAVASGVTEVEPGKGSYVLVPEDTVPAHFAFDALQGNYIVSFYEAGRGSGDYATEGISPRGEIIYIYVGEGNGDHRVGKVLHLPKRNRLVTVGAQGQRGKLFLDAEGDFSFYDANILSSQGDTDNLGMAMYVTGGLQEATVLASKLSLLGEFSSLEERFKAPDKPRNPYFYRNWNLEDVPLEGAENIGGAVVKWTRENAWRLDANYQLLSRSEQDISARKGELAASAGDLTSRGAHLSLLDSKTGDDRDRRFLHGEGAYALWRFVPRLAFETERYRALRTDAPDSGRYYYQGIATLGTRGTGNFRGTVTYSRRHTDYLAHEGGEWFEARENDEIRLDGAYSKGQRIIELVLTHLSNRDLQTDYSSTNDLARVRYRDSWMSSGLTSDVSYRLNSLEERTVERTLVYVGENQGDYDENGNEVGKNRGNYTIVYMPGEDTEPIHVVEFSWRFSLGSGLRGVAPGGGNGGWWGAVRRNLSWDSFITVLEKSRTDNLLELYSLNPALLQSSGSTIYGKNETRQDISFFNAVKKFDLRLSLGRRDEKDSRSADISTDSYARDIKVRAEVVPYATFSIAVEGGTDLSEKRSSSGSIQDYRVNMRFLSGIFNYRLRPSTSLVFEMGAEDREDEVSTAEQVSYIAKPAFNSSLGTHIYLNAFIKFTYTDVKNDASKPLFFLEEGMREDWNVIGQYRLNRWISFGVNYNGRREKNYRGEVKTLHDFKVETRAYF